MLILRSLFIALLVITLSHPSAAAPAREPATPWTQLRTEHFLFIGDAGERNIRHLAHRLEQFRETMIRALGEAAARAPVPAVVLVFANERSFAPYKPTFHNRPIETNGFLLPTDHANYIVMRSSQDSGDFRVMFHEYTHVIVNGMADNVPVWLNEGLAQYCETLESRDGGRVVLMGRPQADIIDTLNDSPLMPLAELMRTERTSPAYNSGDRRGVFYAQSWALVHYLLSDASRSSQLATYLTAIRGGADPGAALALAFNIGTGVLEDELRSYVRRFTFRATQFTFATRTAALVRPKGSPLSEVEARVYLAEILVALGRPDQARAELHRAFTIDPEAPRALSVLGTIELRAGRTDAALLLLERAAELAPDDGWIQGVLGRALGERLRRTRGEPGHVERLRRAQAVLAKAAMLAPSAASTVFQLGLVELEAGADMSRVTALIERAFTLAPASDHYRAALSRILMAAGECERATVLLESPDPIAALMTFRQAGSGSRPNGGEGQAMTVEAPPEGRQVD